MLSRKRVNKWVKRMNSLPLSPAIFSYATLQGKPLSASPAEHCGAELVPRPFRTLHFFYFYNNLTFLLSRNQTITKRSRKVFLRLGRIC